ncbi:MAG: FAD-binding oxidoreductase [Paracoccaceae bacterium]
MNKQAFHNLRIQSIEKETEGSSRIRFALPETLLDEFHFKPGQYISIKFEMKKKAHVRTYSISSEPDKNFIEIGVKHIKNGMFSNFLKTKKLEDIIQISNPEGSFVLDRKEPSRLLLIAAGSGITPMISILKSLLKKNTRARVTLLYSNKTYADMMYRNEIQNLKDKYLDRLVVFNFFSREIQGTDFLNGRITADKITFLSERNLIDIQTIDQCFICGPMEMTKELRSYLKDRGLSERKIKTELFYVAKNKTVNNKVKNLDPSESKIEVLIDGSKKILYMNKNDDFIEKATQYGINVPYSCKNGMCATCRCRVSSGEVIMKKNFSLEDWEIKKGFVLSCQLEPIDKEICLDFDII